MKERIIHITITVVMVLGIAGPAQGGLLGERYIGIQVSQTTPGNDDVKDIDDSILGLGGIINVPINTNVDAVFSLGYSKLEGELVGIDCEATSIGLLGGLNYHFTPDEKVDPFVGIAVGLVKTSAKASYLGYELSEDQDDFALSIGGGIEIDLNDQISLRPNIGHFNVGGEDDFAAGVGLNVWFNKSIFGGLAVSYGFDEGDVSYSVGIGFGF